MDHYLNDPAAWVGVAFLIFVAIAIKMVFPKLGTSLDDYSGKIKLELEQAAALKAEAEILLKAAQKQSADAKANASEIIERAKFEAKLIADEAEKDIEREIERKMQIAAEKIQRAETAAVENVRKKAIENAIDAAAEILKQELSSGSNGEKLVEKSLRLISNNL